MLNFLGLGGIPSGIIALLLIALLACGVTIKIDRANLGASEARRAELSARIAQQNDALGAIEAKAKSLQAANAILLARQPIIEKRIVTRIEKQVVPGTCNGSMQWLRDQAPGAARW